MNYLISTDIGGTNIRCALFESETCKQIRVEKISTQNPSDPSETAVDRLIACIKKVWPEEGDVLGICSAAPGSINFNEGMVLLAPNIPGWFKLPLREILETQFNTFIIVENDANMAAYGEFKRGAGRGHKNINYFTISTGLGGGIIINGKLLQGEIGIATEVGHITVLDKGALCGCGKAGHWESYSSGTGIEHFVENEIKVNPELGQPFNTPTPSAAEIANAARNGNGLAIAAFEQAGYFMGVGVANYLHIFNPSCVIFGGGVMMSGDLIMESFHTSLKQHVINDLYLENLKITTAELGDNAGLIGSAEFLNDQLLEQHKY